MIVVRSPQDSCLQRLLQEHPGVVVEGTFEEPGLEFSDSGRTRRIRVGDRSCEVRGLIELMDNNPLVCTDLASVPSSAATLALIALGPAFKSGVIRERPTFTVNIPASEADLEPFLETVGWESGITLDVLQQPLDGVVAATALAVTNAPIEPEEIEALYAEIYDRSFFVRHEPDAEWHVRMVIGKPLAVYRISVATGEDSSLLTVHVMADQNGKCGAAQVLHMFNIMCGFEESLGIAT